jgi:tRNA (cmo5U34)-methyltransferase
MLERAQQRVAAAGASAVRPLQIDLRDARLEPGSFDVIVAAAVLHHLRTDDEWRAVFAKLFHALAPQGSLWIFDLVDCDIESLRPAARQRYGKYLESLKGPAYRDEVFAYVEKEDTPRSLAFQLDLLRSVGFQSIEVLHKHGCFAAFGAVRL